MKQIAFWSGKKESIYNVWSLGAGIMFFNFSTLCIQNVNNIGTKYVRIMKQTAFWRGKKESIYNV